MMDFQKSKENMIKQQVRVLGVASGPLLDAMVEIPRESFFPDDRQSLSYADMSISAVTKQFDFSPTMIVQLMQVLNVSKKDQMLLVGEKNGYLAAIMARLGQSLYLLSATQDEKIKYRLKSVGAYNVKHLQRLDDSTQKTTYYNIIVLLPFTLTDYKEDLQYYIDKLNENGRLLFFKMCHGFLQGFLAMRAKNETGVSVKHILDFYADPDDKKNDKIKPFVF